MSYALSLHTLDQGPVFHLTGQSTTLQNCCVMGGGWGQNESSTLKMLLPPWRTSWMQVTLRVWMPPPQVLEQVEKSETFHLELKNGKLEVWRCHHTKIKLSIHDIFIELYHSNKKVTQKTNTPITYYLVICSIKHLCLNVQVVLSDQHILSAINPKYNKIESQSETMFDKPMLPRPNFSRLCQDYVCQDHAWQDHVCWDHFCQDLVSRYHVMTNLIHSEPI